VRLLHFFKEQQLSPRRSPDERGKATRQSSGQRFALLVTPVAESLLDDAAFSIPRESPAASSVGASSYAPA